MRKAYFLMHKLNYVQDYLYILYYIFSPHIHCTYVHIPLVPLAHCIYEYITHFHTHRNIQIRNVCM